MFQIEEDARELLINEMYRPLAFRVSKVGVDDYDVDA